MKLNEVIRMNRKKQNLTQEQIANYLGVTAPAVNKWENGISYPDITLLAPLARILKINTDTLLSFNEELTENEMNNLLKEVTDIIRNEGFERGYERGESLIKEYPNCDLFILQMAEILNAFIKIKEVVNAEKYQNNIFQWFELLTTSKQQNVATMATMSIVNWYMGKEEYEKAQQLLDGIPPLGYDKNFTQALLYGKQGKSEQVYEIYENMLYKNANQLSNILQLLSSELCREKKYEKAEIYANLAEKIGNQFDLGAYSAFSARLFIAIEMKDKDLTLTILDKMISQIDTIVECSRNSPLYKHMKFKDISNMREFKDMFKKGLESDVKMNFIKDDPRLRKIINRLE